MRDSKQKTAENVYAPEPVFCTNGGVITPMMKLESQFEEADSETPFARKLDGNISDGIAQGTGPVSQISESAICLE